MFWYLSGTIILIEGNTLTLEVEWTGLWYEIIVSPTLLSSGIPWEKKAIWIYHHKTDVSEVLFWFANRDERELFQSLIKVNGVGGKTAIALLGLGETELLKAIQFEDDILLSSVPGIGKKTAQKIIVELKGSIDFSKKSQSTPSNRNSDTLLISSLVGMGYDKRRVEEVIETIDTNLSLQERTVQAIRKLSQ